MQLISTAASVASTEMKRLNQCLEDLMKHMGYSEFGSSLRSIENFPANRYIIKQRQKKNYRPLNKQKLANVMKTTGREDRRIVRQALVDPTVTRSTIRVDVGVAIVPQTISRHLAEANLKSKRPFRALPLTPEHRQLRLQWCQARSMWNVTDWQKVVFSDESRFLLGTDDIRVRVWRCPGERYNSTHTVLRHTARTAGVMVWGP
ncbi:transposable element Tcb2 transposase [Trichonephila clavipes]|nr:transposable element Tcb2 transposase [Trichonephila clavipes]